MGCHCRGIRHWDMLINSCFLVDALKQIGKTLGKEWNFSVDPCSGGGNWITPNAPKGYNNTVTCNCSYESNTICHVVSISLKAQSLPGSVPREMVRLPYLQFIDLSRNYLNGTIPPEWGTMEQLVNISLLGNRITGPIPGELSNISTLENLVLEYNQLSGNISLQFGNFSSIKRILLTSNNLTGELPATLAKLTTLIDFRIGDNNFSGSIPNFIENWTSLEKLVIQGSGLSGPIPSGIASMTNLSDLRISDLNGNDSTFPPLNNTKNLERLILRSCNITDEIPIFVGTMTKLKVLDLSFNKLSGPIPVNFEDLSKTGYIYLTGNSLTGPLPPWMLKDGESIDLSYNNLMSESTPPNCQLRNLNLFESSKGNTTGITSCLRDFRCEKKYYFLHINCGGREVKVDDKGTTYDADGEPGGSSNFVQSKTNWAFSSTGHFLDEDRKIDSYIRDNNSRISGQNPQLYMNARLSPLSLTYYGFCLENGNYIVTLHFAEIMFADDRTYSSLGRRIFDVYVQGTRVLKDFNIEYEAGGVNKAIFRNFTAAVTANTVEIRLYWAGKGTTGIPDRGVYGPLISAISVNADFPVPSENGKSMSTGAIVGIIVAVLFTILLVLGILWWKGCLGSKDTIGQDLKGLDLHTGSFPLRQIKAATNNFDPANKIGEGGFGPVYKGLLSDGTIIAVKQLSSKSKQGNREFVNEIGMISALQHPHLVKLHGCCIEGNQLLLVYEYMENNSLARALFGPEEYQLKLDWPTRHKICVGIARGLAYLHEESRLKIVHRDIKATNVLLDKNLNPKISDFGLAKLDEEDNTHISTRVAGTFGYMAPEYAMRGYLTDKADVYSFGVVLLEIVTGRSNTSIRPKEDSFYLLDWANSLKAKGKLMELVDPRLESNFNKKEVIATINVALHCTNAVGTERPSMSAVVSILEGREHIQGFVPDSSVSLDEMKPKEITSQDQVTKSNDDQSQIISMDVPWTASSTSTSDLYPITMDTDYWENRT
ncbi:putative leucine-rich repeat receptor-like serine/threonine-protein kinase [Forsythia ovata]|uniref:non-specific serine/threonine protein kinase n=1 Tax=Forsythia ovata TaxID=205694 RepID=A0ABD1NVE6_9LAMI